MFQPGQYIGVINEAWMDTLDNNKRTPYLNIMVTITHVLSPDGSAWEGVQEDHRSLRLFTTNKAWPYTHQKLQALGFNGRFEAPAFTEKQVQLECTIQPGNDGKQYENWDLASWGAKKDAAPPSKDVIRQLNARWKTQQSADKLPPPSQGQAQAPAPAPQPQEQPQPEYVPPDDDIPF